MKPITMPGEAPTKKPTEDDVLRRMLNTPPKPKAKPKAPAQPAQKKTGP